MEKIEDGGPAFPVPGQMSDDGRQILNESFPGLTKREYFAAAALTGFISNGGLLPGDYARLSYEVADAMIAMLKQSAQTEKGDK